MNNLQSSWRLILIILIAMSLIPIGDTAAKLLTAEGVPPQFVVWSRLFIGAICLIPFCRIQKSEYRLLFNWKILLRAIIFICSVSSIMRALETEPLANVFGAFFIGPIISYFLAVILLKEKISLVGSMLLLIGFGGALLVIKPSFSMTSGMLFAAMAGCFYGSFLVVNRWLANEFRTRFILISTLIIGSIVLAPFSLDFKPSFDIRTGILVLISSLSSAIGNLLIIELNRKLSASMIAPFIYTQLLAATLLGWLVFDSLPDFLTSIGLMILTLSGLLSFLMTRQSK